MFDFIINLGYSILSFLEMGKEVKNAIVLRILMLKYCEK